MIEIKFEDIKPVGNFYGILCMFKLKSTAAISHANSIGKYHPSLAFSIKQMVSDFRLLSALEDGIVSGTVWNVEEAIIDLLYSHLIIMELNNCAQKYLNGIIMDNPKDQLIDLIEDKKRENCPAYLKFKVV